MRALKVISEGVTASFRYPHVQIGKLPTFEMPPPATIYGHLAGVLGEWFDPAGLEFAYIFEHRGKGEDLETGQPIERGSGKAGLAKCGWNFPVNVECAPNPQRREFLFRPRLTLYLRGDTELLARFQESFLHPTYAYIMGRSQDLATCLAAEMAELSESEEAFFSHTLLPFGWRQWVLPGATVHMPKAINYNRRREPTFERYLQVLWPPLKLYNDSQDTFARNQLPDRFAVDGKDLRDFIGRSLPRGLYFHPVIGPGLM